MKIQTRSFPVKVMYVVIAAMLLMLGVLGLIIPVLPGVIFILLAILLLAQVSSRVNRWARKQPLMRKANYQLSAFSQLRWPDRARLAGWMLLDSVNSGVQFICKRFSNRS